MSNNLPLQISSFIGREREIAEVSRLLSSSRLVTLTGAGGCGKTRLAEQAAATMLNGYADGVWLVEFAPLAVPSLVSQAIASVLGVPEQPAQPLSSTLTDYLRHKELLLLLDNCEHLIEACAALTHTLLQSCPQLKILATSREALKLTGEMIFVVPSLSLPRPEHVPAPETLMQFESVRLFCERASAVQSRFTLTPENAASVAHICQRLDGIPLAIELIAARTTALPVQQIAARLDDLFDLVTVGSRAVLPRHRTLRAAIDWSYDLLPEPERTAYQRLSTFAGGWTLDAAEFVCAGDGIGSVAVLDLLSRLVEKSLIVSEEQHGVARYRMLETVRQYAREKLLESGEAERVRDRHQEFFVRLADLFDANFYGPDDAHWFSRMEIELDNVRAAITWAIENRNALYGLRLAGSLRVFWVRRHPGEAQARLAEVLSMPEASARTVPRARALLSYGTLLMFLARPDKYLAARQAFEEMLGIAKEVRDEQSTVDALLFLGWVLIAMGDNASAQTLLNQACGRARAAGDHFSLGHAYWFLGEVAFSEDRIEASQVLFEKGAAELRALNAKNFLGGPTLRLGQVALRQADYQQSGKWIRESLALLGETGDLRGVGMCLAAFAALRFAEGQIVSAARLCGAVDALLDSLHTGLLPLDQTLYERTLADLHHRLDAAAFDVAWTEGRALVLEQVIAEVERVTPTEHSAPLSSTATPADPLGLTARELEVLRLVVVGLSDAQIAERLVISRRTISTHLTAIYGKLGVHSRSNAILYALAHKLN